MNYKLPFTLLFITMLLAACSPTPVQADIPSSIVLSDGLGRTVTLANPAQRIISLTPATTEILFAIGAGDQVIGRDMFSDYPAEALAVTDIGGSYGAYNAEAIVALQPDLVLAGGINSPELVASLEQLGLNIYFLANPVTLEEMFTNLEIIGQIAGHSTKAAALVESLQARVAALDVRVAPLSYGPVVYYELDATDPSKPFTAGPGTFVDLLIQRAGGINFGSQLEGLYPQISLEPLLVANPNLIILGDSAYGETPEKVAARPGWESLSAVQEGKIYPIDDDLVTIPGPRLVDGLETLAQLLHPELFK